MKGGFALFQGLLTSWLEKTSLFPGKDLHIDLILNAHTHNYERSKQLALNPTTCLGIELHVFNENCIVDAGSNGRNVKRVKLNLSFVLN